MSSNVNDRKTDAGLAIVNNQFETIQDQLRRGNGRILALEKLQLVASTVASTKFDLEKRFEIMQAFVAPYHMEHSQKDKMKETLLKVTANKNDHPLIRAYAAERAAEIYANVECNLAEAIKLENRVLRICQAATKAERKQYVRELDDEDVPRAMKTKGALEWTRKQAGRVMDDLRKSARTSIKCMRDPFTFMGEKAKEAGNTPGWKEASKQMRSFASNYERGNNNLTKFALPSLTGSTMQQIKELPEEDVTLLLCFDDATYLGKGPSPIGRNKRLVRAFTVDEARYRSGETRCVFRHQAIAFCPAKDSIQKLLVGIFIKHCLHEYVMPEIRKVNFGLRPRKVLLPPEAGDDTRLRGFFTMMGCSLIEQCEPKMMDLLLSTLMEALVDNEHLRTENAPHFNDVMRGIQCVNCKEIGPSLKICPCQRVYYCSKACQEAEWPNHKRDHSRYMKLIKQEQQQQSKRCATEHDRAGSSLESSSFGRGKEISKQGQSP